MTCKKTIETNKGKRREKGSQLATYCDSKTVKMYTPHSIFFFFFPYPWLIRRGGYSSTVVLKVLRVCNCGICNFAKVLVVLCIGCCHSQRVS